MTASTVAASFARSPLSDAGVQHFLERSPVLQALMAYFEAGEDWTTDAPGTSVDGVLISDLGLRMMDPAPAPAVSREKTAEVLTYVRASRVLRIHDWLDATPENSVVAMLQDREVSPVYRRRLSTMLSILARGMVFNHIFNEKRRKEILEAIRESQENP